ncbi:MAG TPA: hypothetical protein VHZ50_16575 [Puia sp.]|nr:hypothetical protein [Puia sp.]
MINNETFYDIYLNCLDRVSLVKEKLIKFPANIILQQKLRRLKKELKASEAEVKRVITVYNENKQIKIKYPHYPKTRILSIDKKNRLILEEQENDHSFSGDLTATKRL